MWGYQVRNRILGWPPSPIFAAAGKEILSYQFYAFVGPLMQLLFTVLIVALPIYIPLYNNFPKLLTPYNRYKNRSTRVVFSLYIHILSWAKFWNLILRTNSGIFFLIY